MTNGTVSIETRQARRKDTCENFTPSPLTNEMLDKVPEKNYKESTTICDLACGSGNILVWDLIRQLKKGYSPLVALKLIVGIDVQQDNVKECQLRLLKLISIFETITEEHIKTVLKNIFWINPKKHPLGSLEFDFSSIKDFKNPDPRKVERWIKWICNDNILNNLPMPSEVVFSSNGSVDLFEDTEKEDG